MTSEVVRPEVNPTPETPIFDFGAMTDDQVDVLSHALQLELDYRYDNHEDWVNHPQVNAADTLIDLFTKSMGVFAERNFDRAKALVYGWATSQNKHDLHTVNPLEAWRTPLCGAESPIFRGEPGLFAA